MLACVDEPLLDAGHDGFALRLAAVDREPSRTFGDPHAHQEDDSADHRAGQEGEPPAEFGIDPGRVEEPDRDQRAERRADPERAVDHEVDMPAEARRDQLLDRRVDGGVFAADAAAGEEPEEKERRAVPRSASKRGRDQVDSDGDEKQELASQAVGQPAEEQGAEHGAGQVGAGGDPDFRIGKMQRRASFQGAGDRSGQRHLEPVEDPGDPESGDDEDMKPAPGQPLQPRGYEG